MKHLLASLLLIVFTATLSAQNYKIDTTVNETWTNNAWQLTSRTINTYNSACQLVSTLSQARVGANWVNQSLNSYTYTSGDNISQTTLQSWNTVSNTWENTFRITNTYNASLKVTVTLSETWNGSAWGNTSRETNIYDANGYLTSSTSEMYQGGLWINQSREIYTNNADGTVNQQVEQEWDIATSAWINETRNAFVYNANKLVQQSVTETWTGTAWENETRKTFTYDAQGRQLTSLSESWEENAWINESLITSTYNGSGQLTTILFQNWNTGTSSWSNFLQSTYSYNANGSLFQTVTQVVPQGSTTLTNAQRSTFHYTTDCILPLTLLNFSAELSGKDVLVKWTTTEEINTSYFTIESSSDANNFKKIGTVKATNDFAQTNYQFTDANPAGLASGKIFYRIRMVDIDGKFSYSKIAYVGMPIDENGFAIFPTAVKDNLFLRYKSTSTAKAGIRILDISGRQVYNQQMNLQQSANQYNINVTALPKGVYFIQLVMKEGTKTARFIKN